MSLRTTMIVMLALIFGGSAAFGINAIRNQQAMGSAPQVETVPVVLVEKDVPLLQGLTADDLKIQQCPKELVPEGALTSVAEALDRTARGPLVKGEWLLERMLNKKGADGLQHLIPEGMRACAITTSGAAASGGGFILPGCKIDVHLAENASSRHGSSPAFEKAYIQNVRVLAINQKLQTAGENKIVEEVRTVSLLVSPGEAEKLAKARGILHLSLRNPGDDTSAVAISQKPEAQEIRIMKGSSESRVFIQSALANPSVPNVKPDLKKKKAVAPSTNTSDR